MSYPTISRRKVMQATAATASSLLLPRRATAATQVQVLTNRYPAMEVFVEKMRNVVPGVDIAPQLMPFDKMMELQTISLSSKADTLDIFVVGDAQLTTFVRNGWMRPLDDLWARYKEEFKLDDFADAAVRAFTVDGHIYAVPNGMTVMLLFYRKDLLDAAGRQPPKTMAEYVELAKLLNTPARAGTVNCLKPIDACICEMHWYLNTIGNGWFDDKWHPVFNNAAGVQAIETLKEVTRNAQRGYATAGNDECMIALQQDVASMGLQWVTRANAMDNPKQSRVIGKFEFAAPPSGKARVTPGGWAISAFSKQDPDVMFRIMAASTNAAVMRELGSINLPCRKSVLADPELTAKNHFYPAAAASLETSVPYPALPEFYSVSDFIARHTLEAMAGDKPVKLALDQAATETEQFLKDRGYYK